MSITKNRSSPSLMVPIDICPRRLIDTETLQLVNFSSSPVIPPYAILSHRWILGEEVVHDEFTQPRKETFSKSGYRKIQAACQQARQDGIRYIWVDTCCIKQGNHDDVTANIVSMYAFYQNAEVCYAYLGDVLEKEDMFGKTVQRRLKEGSEWFKRGWTLQELLAPRTVVFFNRDWQCIGNKHKLRDLIHTKTTIPPDVLSGRRSLQDIDVLTRMSWASRRETTKSQDAAYCLQGLLGVTVQPDYNELWFTSFNRLGKALFDTRPELRAELGIQDHFFCNPYSSNLWYLLSGRFSDAQDMILDAHRERILAGHREVIKIRIKYAFLLISGLSLLLIVLKIWMPVQATQLLQEYISLFIRYILESYNAVVCGRSCAKDGG